MRVPFSWPRDRGVRFKYLDRPNSLEVTGALREPSEYHIKGAEHSCLPILDRLCRD
ncbi:hypothetical protein ALC62_00903 [Cyphomyrmex costatus]|uniref:Uncharacterized protein n=1 Tax=Cyphomyrmex costatus TaxID=456900 RepID=A0A195D595_9HYME|nr:hypothetical protein ALC62_00903 [Cyphomyrmex costatus]